MGHGFEIVKDGFDVSKVYQKLIENILGESAFNWSTSPPSKGQLIGKVKKGSLFSKYSSPERLG